MVYLDLNPLIGGEEEKQKAKVKLKDWFGEFDETEIEEVNKKFEIETVS